MIKSSVLVLAMSFVLPTFSDAWSSDPQVTEEGKKQLPGQPHIYDPVCDDDDARDGFCGGIICPPIRRDFDKK